MKIYIHTGHASVDNGARFPLTWYFELPKAIGVDTIQGEYYGDDSLRFDDELWPTVKEMLEENNMLYRIDGQPFEWQNKREGGK